MRTALAAFSLAIGLSLVFGLICSQGAAALPAAPAPIGQSATATSPVQHTQYAERRTRHGIMKCYRDFIFGPYRCHYY